MSIRVAAPVEIIRGFFNLEHSSIKGTSSISGEAIFMKSTFSFFIIFKLSKSKTETPKNNFFLCAYFFNGISHFLFSSNFFRTFHPLYFFCIILSASNN